MKKTKIFIAVFLFLAMFCLVSGLRAQVQWSFTAKKTADKTYDLHCTATIGAGWHIYSQFTPDGGPVPSEFSFSANPMVERIGVVKEAGKLEQHHEPLFGVDVKQFSNTVDFIQSVKIKAKVKTTVTGKLKYMACNDSQCLPPKEVTFTIALQ
jgi:hypothetical protein